VIGGSVLADVAASVADPEGLDGVDDVDVSGGAEDAESVGDAAGADEPAPGACAEDAPGAGAAVVPGALAPFGAALPDGGGVELPAAPPPEPPPEPPEPPEPAPEPPPEPALLVGDGAGAVARTEPGENEGPPVVPPLSVAP
jgi:hypothetical protein